jgi:hypothetical protein
VSVCAVGLPVPVGRVVGERHSPRAALARVELVDLARHAVGDLPLRDRLRVEERPVDCRTGGVDVAGDAGEGHATVLPSAPRTARVTQGPRSK